MNNKIKILYFVIFIFTLLLIFSSAVKTAKALPLCDCVTNCLPRYWCDWDAGKYNLCSKVGSIGTPSYIDGLCRRCDCILNDTKCVDNDAWICGEKTAMLTCHWYLKEDCGTSYWTNEYRCIGTMQQRKYVSRGCSGGRCYSNEIWYNERDCGTDYWTNEYRCIGTMQQRKLIIQDCSGGYCYSNPSWRNWQECGTDFWTNEYRCIGTMQQRKYVSRGCSGSSCYYNEIWYDWVQCGSDYWGTLYSCSGDWRTREYFSRGCSGISCYLIPSYQNWENCNNYDGWYGSQLRDYYCSSGACVYSGNTIPNIPTLIAPPHNTWINYNPTFQAQVSDPDNNQVRAYFNIVSYADYWGNFVNSGGISSYGAINLGNCAQYWWRTYAQDSGGLISNWTGYWLAKVDKDVPTAGISYATTSEQLTFPVTLTESDSCSGISIGDVEVRSKLASSPAWSAYQDYSTTINDFIYTGTDNYQYQFRYRVKDLAGNWSAFAEGGVILVDLNDPPTATNLSYAASDVCNKPVPFYTFNWTYSDPDSDKQSRYILQIDNNSDFSSPQVNMDITGLSDPSPSIDSQSIIVATQPSLNQLGFNTTYYWRARVYDEHSLPSNWTNGIPFSLTTPVHHYPSCDFTWIPNYPNTGEAVNFTDASRCWDEDPVNGSDCSIIKGDTYLWTITSGDPSTSVLENPSTTFSSPGNYNVILRVTDSDGHACSTTKSVRVNYPLPKWREILPW